MHAESANPLAWLRLRAAEAIGAGLWLLVLASTCGGQTSHPPVTQDRINEVAGALLSLPPHFAGLTARRRPNEPMDKYAARLHDYVQSAEMALRATAWMRTPPALHDTSTLNRQRWARLAAEADRLAALSAAGKTCVAETLHAGKPSTNPRTLERTGATLAGILDTINAIVQDLRDARP